MVDPGGSVQGEGGQDVLSQLRGFIMSLLEKF